MNILAIDLGGTTAKVGLVNQDGKILKKETIKTDKKNIVGNIKKELEGKINDDEYQIISFAAPGAIDSKNGILKWSGNLEVENLDIKKEVKKHFNKNAFILNDANAAILGEVWTGAAKNEQNAIMYTLGTGIGGGIVINGDIVLGEFGFAGELGHGGNFQNEAKCNCGNDGCIEAAASAINIEKKVDAEIKKAGLEDKFKDGHLSIKYHDGTKEMKQIIEDGLLILCDHISTMIYALDPKVIIIGGGMSGLGDTLLGIIREGMKSRVGEVFLKGKEFKIATLGNDAGIIGAAAYAIKHNS